MAKSLLYQAKTATNEMVGLEYVFGALLGVHCEEADIDELLTYNESPQTYIQFGILLERQRAEATKRGPGRPKGSKNKPKEPTDA